ncbi:MAG: NAD-dependent epimerase/dehydratase family protein [Richelia sp. RM1_1_1]|nr:NAD-dependent epimerase/dehydratase family protein [Richelia sp. RM1_1_1]
MNQSQQNKKNCTVILGASGGFGTDIRVELLARGETLRLVTRSPQKLPNVLQNNTLVEIKQDTDVLDIDSLSKTFYGADTVMFGLNRPYPEWEPFMSRALEATIKAALMQETPPRIVFPGNVYALGTPGETPFDENAVNASSTKKGQIRAKLENMLRQASEKHGLKVLIVRASDFFGPNVRNGFVDRIFGNIVEGKPADIFGAGKTLHQFTYVPDLAKAIAELLQNQEFGVFEIVNAPSIAEISIKDLVDMAAHKTGQPHLSVRSMSWNMVSLIGIFSPMLREVAEMKYLYEMPIRLDTSKFETLVPGFKPTSLEEAISETLRSYGATKLMCS